MIVLDSGTRGIQLKYLFEIDFTFHPWTFKIFQNSKNVRKNIPIVIRLKYSIKNQAPLKDPKTQKH